MDYSGAPLRPRVPGQRFLDAHAERMRAAKGDKIKLHDLERRGDFVSAYLSARQRLPPLLLDLSRNGGTLWVVSTGGPQSVVPLCEIKIVNRAAKTLPGGRE